MTVILSEIIKPDKQKGKPQVYKCKIKEGIVPYPSSLMAQNGATWTAVEDSDDYCYLVKTHNPDVEPPINEAMECI